jgi:phospholipid transport system substrate-binding protein
VLNHLLRARSLKELSILLLVLALSLAGAGTGVAAETTAPLGPLGLVQSSVARVLGIAQSSPVGSNERRTGIVRVSHELFDFNEIARRALGQHWKGLSPGEQAEFVQLVTDVLDRAFIASVDGYPNGNVAFLGETIDGPRAQVRSRIIANNGAAISIDYRLHQSNARWAVYDVVSEDVSLVANYRSQLNSVIRVSSFADVLERIRTDRLRRREPSAQMPIVPSRLAAGLLLAVLTRHAPTSK